MHHKYIINVFCGQDRTPLETERPTVGKDVEAAASDLYEKKLHEIHENPKDPYDSQLAKSRAARVTTAEKLLDKAAKDPKVQKAIKKKPDKSAKAKGKARGNGGANVEVDPKSRGGGEGESTQDAKGPTGDENPEAPESVEDPWPAKDPISQKKNA